jgi:hypothetical protein
MKSFRSISRVNVELKTDFSELSYVSIIKADVMNMRHSDRCFIHYSTLTWLFAREDFNYVYSPWKLQSQNQSHSYFTTGGLPPISSSWRQAPWDPRSVFFQLNNCGSTPHVRRYLTRGWGCRLQLLLVLASTVIYGSESCGTHDYILLSQIRDSPNLEGQVPVFISPRNMVARLYLQTLVCDSEDYGRGFEPAGSVKASNLRYWYIFWGHAGRWKAWIWRRTSIRSRGLSPNIFSVNGLLWNFVSHDLPLQTTVAYTYNLLLT